MFAHSLGSLLLSQIAVSFGFRKVKSILNVPNQNDINPNNALVTRDYYIKKYTSKYYRNQINKETNDYDLYLKQNKLNKKVVRIVPKINTFDYQFNYEYINFKELNNIDCLHFMTFIYKFHLTSKGYQYEKILFRIAPTPELLLTNFNNRHLYILFLMYKKQDIKIKEISILLNVSTQRVRQIISDINRFLSHPKIARSVFGFKVIGQYY